MSWLAGVTLIPSHPGAPKSTEYSNALHSAPRPLWMFPVRVSAILDVTDTTLFLSIMHVIPPLKKVESDLPLTARWLHRAAIALLSFPLLTSGLPQSGLITGTQADGSVSVTNTYVLQEQELELIQLIAQHPLQQRPAIYLDPALTIYAKIKADDLANRTYFAHRDPQGNLITYYLGNAVNSLAQTYENLAAGYPNASATVEAWERSTTGHRESLFGLPMDGVPNPLYPHFGVGFANNPEASDSYGGRYWSTQNAWNPGAHAGPVGNPSALAYAAQYRLLMPDGRTPVDPNWNWVRAEVAGMDPVRVASDGSYHLNWMGSFRNLGGMFFSSNTLGFSYSHPDRVRGGNHFFVSKQGWLWTTPALAPHYWSSQRGNWIYADLSAHRIYDYNNGIWEDWTPDGPYARILADKRQTYVGQPVVIAWDADAHAANVEFWSSQSGADGLPTYHFNQRNGAILWHPPAPGSYVFAVRSKAKVGNATVPGQHIVAENLRIDVIPHPDSYATAAVQIQSSHAEAALREAFTIAWNARGGIPIVRSHPGISPASVDGVFSNEASGSVQFVKQVPGVYRYTIQLGSLVQAVEVRVVGSRTTPEAPR